MKNNQKYLRRLGLSTPEAAAAAAVVLLVSFGGVHAGIRAREAAKAAQSSIQSAEAYTLKASAKIIEN